MTFNELYMLNDEWDFDTLLIIVEGSNRYKTLTTDKFEVITADEVSKKYGKRYVYSFSNNIVRLVSEA